MRRVRSAGAVSGSGLFFVQKPLDSERTQAPAGLMKELAP
jgi:hypothetical protein